MSRTYSISCERCQASCINGVACHEHGCTGHFVCTHKGEKYLKFRVFSLDVWGNERDGFEVNDRSETSAVYVQVGATDKEIIQAMKRAGLLNKRCRFSSFSIEGDDGLLMVDSSKTSEPLFQLELQ